ncbi:MAG TPA: CBS domain-containing protein [Nitrosopumilaceae archaeon]|nr:CBS domain-containing protein [Nitrosopumilaceae archaeon]
MTFVGKKLMEISKFKSPVITVNPSASIHDTLVKMQLNFIKRIVVVDENKPVGIVTERDISRFLENDKTARALDEIPISHVMQKNPISVTDGFEDHFEQCTTRMDTFNIGSIIMVDSDGKLIGIVTKTDITKAFSVIYGGKCKVRDYMSEKVITCRESDTLRYALNMINTNNISRLVVTDSNGNPTGIITTNTFLTHSSYFTNGKTRTRDYLLPTRNEVELCVGDLVQKEIVIVSPDDDLATAAHLMIKNEISGIPVVSNEKIVGIITKFDVVKAFADAGINERLKVKYKNTY